MAASVEGAFKLIDRASGQLRSIERQAIKTDLALEKLGITMDLLGSSKRQRALSKVDQNIRDIGNDSRIAENRVRSLGRGFDDLDRRTSRSNRSQKTFLQLLKGVTGEIGKLATVGKFVGLGAGIGVLIQGVGALSGGVAALLPRLSDLGYAWAPSIAGVTGLGLAVVTTKLAFNDLKKAFAGNKKALAQLTPEGRSFLSVLKSYKPIIKEFRESAQRGLFGGLTDAFRQLRTAAPTINRAIGQMSQRLGDLARIGAKRLTSASALGDFSALSQQGGTLITRLGLGIMNVVGGLRHIAIAARPFTDWLSKVILLWTKHFEINMQVARESGNLARAFDRTKHSLQVLGHFLSDAWKILKLIGQAARPLGNELWGAANKGLDGWIRFHQTVAGRNGLTVEFLKMGDAVKAIAKLVGNLGAAIFRMGTSSQLPKTVDALNKLVPALEKVLNSLANTFGPPIARLLSDFGTLLSSLTGATGPFTILINAVDLVVKGLTAIVNLGTPLKNMFTAALSVFLIQRYLVKLELLRKGWLGVGAAALWTSNAEKAAAVSGAESMAVSGAASSGILGNKGMMFLGGFGKMRGRIGGLFGRGAAATTVAEGEQMVLPGMEAAAGAGEAGLLGGGAMMAAKLGLGVAGKFLLPLTVLQGLIGAFSAGRSGSFGHQTLQTGYGAIRGISMGLLPQIGGLMTPGQIAQGRVSRDETQMQKELDATAKIHGALAQTEAQLGILSRHADMIGMRNEQVTKDYLASMQQEIEARKQTIAVLRQEAQQKATGKTLTLMADLSKLYRQLIGQGNSPSQAQREADTYALQSMMGIGDLRTRKLTGRSILHSVFAATGGGPEYNRVQAAIQKAFPNLLARAGNLFGGGPGEFRRLNAGLMRPSERQLESVTAGPTAAQSMMIYHLMAAGLTKTMAKNVVMSHEGSVKGLGKIDPAPAILNRIFSKLMGENSPLVVQLRKLNEKPPPAQPSLSDMLRALGDPKVQKRLRGQLPFGWGGASGGRIPGSGLRDTVPVAPGAMAAPGELIVNRHTEARVNRLLGGRGTLGGLVGRESRKHSDYMAQGGRIAGVGGAVNSVAESVLGHFPGLQVTSGLRPGDSGSYHALGEAVDIGGSSSTMNAAAQWIMASGLWRNLVEGIHNPGLSVKNYSVVPSSFWGASTWGAHANHIHLAAIGAGGGLIGGGGGGGAGGGTPSTPGGSAATNMTLARVVMQQRAQNRLMGFGGNGGKAVAVPGAAASSTTPGGSSPMSLPTSGARSLGYKMMLAHGWGSDQWSPLDSLWTGESGWSDAAMNSSSRAQGIPQFLPMPGRTTPPGFPDTPPVNASQQIAWGLNYIGSRYGSPASAYQTWLGRSPHWYARGGRTPKWGGWYGSGGSFTTNGPTTIGVGERGKETVTVTPGSKLGRAGSLISVGQIGPIIAHHPGDVRREIEEALHHVAQALAGHAGGDGLSD